jgi:hypothetical protein
MTANENDIVCVARGSFSQVQTWHDLLRADGIESRVVGDNLTAGLGTALPGSIELWIHSADAEAAEAALTRADGHSRGEPESHPIPPHGHPASAPKPDRSRAPRHGARPHRPLPS